MRIYSQMLFSFWHTTHECQLHSQFFLSFEFYDNMCAHQAKLPNVVTQLLVSLYSKSSLGIVASERDMLAMEWVLREGGREGVMKGGREGVRKGMSE